MTSLIFDIETIGADFDSFDPETQEYLLRYAQDDAEAKDVKERLGLSPFTGEAIAVGMLPAEPGGPGLVLFRDEGAKAPQFTDADIRYRPVRDESELLLSFWEEIKEYRRIVSFNGRSFDGPFLMIRSAIHHIRPSRNLVPYRYGDEHIDLLDQLQFLGATRQRFNLDMAAKTFGIKSPKAEGINGYHVTPLFKEGGYETIARYCGRDIVATRELFKVWEQYLSFPSRKEW
jgi:DNA polymerase elongation subunit (family B)